MSWKLIRVGVALLAAFSLLPAPVFRAGSERERADGARAVFRSARGAGRARGRCSAAHGGLEAGLFSRKKMVSGNHRTVHADEKR